MMGLTGEIDTETEEPMAIKEALIVPAADEWRRVMEEELYGL